MNDVILKDNINIENLIYEVRGVQVMLDREISATKCYKNILDLITFESLNESI